MNKLMTAIIETKNHNKVKLYRWNETGTGIHMEPHQPKVYQNVTIEQMLKGMIKQGGYKVIETRTAFKERELGDSDEDYMIIQKQEEVEA